MRKVYQQIVCPQRGDCMRAAVASLLDKDLEEVSDFLKFGDDWFSEFLGVFKALGYHPNFLRRNNLPINRYKHLLKYDGGIGGYFYATLPSQTFENITHAVIIDEDMNVVHDPNPNQKALDADPEEIIKFLSLKDFHITKTGKIIDKC